MRKFAIFVEGQTELITVREFLLRAYNYEVTIECRTLFKPGALRKAEYDFSNPDARFYFQIINIGNDKAVLKRILERERRMWESGYEKIIGLRDMYSEAYKEDSQSIDNDVTQKFIDGANETVRNKALSPAKIVMCFAIMEVEAWFIAMYKLFELLDNRLTSDYIKDRLGIDLETVNPETAFFHPTNQMEEIYGLAEMSYDKHKGDIEAIANCLTVQGYSDLLKSDNCNSFNHFYGALEIKE